MNNKKLYRTEGPKAKIFGVCGGVAEYLGVDATVLRVIVAVLTLCGSVGLWVYLVAALIMPKESAL